MTTYASAGVDIAAANRAVELMKTAVRDTYTPAVLAGIGAFGGLFEATSLQAMQQPVLVASTDGVGTKTMVASAMNRYDTVGIDLVNHCINDILVQGAKPLFFLDYFAAARLNPERVATVVAGCAQACREAGCALLGGETAELPGVYTPDQFDLAGTMIGVVDKANVIDGSAISLGDAIIGLASNGLHTNGYSLARKVFADQDWHTPVKELGTSLGEALLKPHTSYLATITQWQRAGVQLKGLAHITGGGLIENLPRILPQGFQAHIRWRSWPVLPIFHLIQHIGNVPQADMLRTFNLGIGMVAVIPAGQIALALATLPEVAYLIGEIGAGAAEARVIVE